MVKNKKGKHKNLKLVLSLIFMSLVLAVSAGGLTIIKGVNASEDNALANNTDIVSESSLAALDYVATGSSGKKEQVKIESIDQAISLINNYFATKSYVVTSNGKMHVAGKIDGIMSYSKLCDIDYWDYFEHEASGRAYWEEGSKMGQFYNSFVETIYDQYMSFSGLNISNLNRFYYINNDEYFGQHMRAVKFTNGFNVSQSVKDSTGLYRANNADELKNNGYKVSYFRWNINNDTVKNAKLTKTITGYQLEFDLTAEVGARDVYKRFTTWIPANVLKSVAPGSFHYVYNFDRFGNVSSFSRDETINMELSGKNVGISATGAGGLTFSFKYNVRTKEDDYKITLDNAFKTAVTAAGYSL